MQLHQLSSIRNQKSKKRVGRGGKRGTYSGRGLKGQKARAGRKIRPAWRDVLKRIPKKRGYRFKSPKERPVTLNLGTINQFFADGETVNLKALLKKGLVAKIKGRNPQVKILGDGELNKKIGFTGLAMSESARKKTEEAGGQLKVKSYLSGSEYVAKTNPNF